MPDRTSPRRDTANRPTQRRPGTSAPQPVAGRHPIATGTAALVPDEDGRRGWTVMVNGVPSSHVDLDDPLRLDFEYMRWIADVIDVHAEEGAALDTLHLGGAGCTLARYVSATRPLSRQLVVEIDPDLVELARQAFGLRSRSTLRTRVADAREALTDLPENRYDIVIRDTFDGSAVPAHLTTDAFVSQVRRVLRPGGVYLANIGARSGPPEATRSTGALAGLRVAPAAPDAVDGLELARREAATAATVFGQLALLGEPAHFRGRRHGNIVLVGSDAPLPLTALGRRLASGAVRARLLADEQVTAFTAGRRPLRDTAG